MESWVVYRDNPYEDRELLVVFDHQPNRDELFAVLATNPRDEYSAEKFSLNILTHSPERYHVSKSGGLFTYIKCVSASGQRFGMTYLEDSYHDKFGPIDNNSNIPKEK